MSKLSNLLVDSLEAYYWLGFLLADGHFSKKNVLKLTVSSKDKTHLEKFVRFLDSDIKVHTGRSVNFWGLFENCYISIMDTKVVLELKNKYSIHSNKTLNPPNLSAVQGDNLKALTVGFIDGDGSIVYQTGRKDVSLKIKCHSSWKLLVENMLDYSGKINSEGYFELCLSDNENLREWKRFCITHQLPVMERKWDRIDETKKGKYLLSKELEDTVTYLNGVGMRNIDISRQLDIGKSHVTQILKRGKL